MAIKTLTQWLSETLLTSRNTGFSRLRVDVAQTGFWEGREFRLNYPMTINTSDVLVLRFTAPIDFVLQLQALSASTVGLRFRAFREAQGTPGGTWTPVGNLLPNNSVSGTPAYTPQITIDEGGTFVPGGSELPAETIDVKVATASGQRITVGGSAIKERGLPAGVYYLVFTNIDAAGDATGIYNLVYEERPS